MSTFKIITKAPNCTLELVLQVALLKSEHFCGVIYSLQPDRMLNQVIHIYW